MKDKKKKYTEEKKELFYFLLVRYESHRDSISTRSTIVLSAAAILITGNIFFVEKALPSIEDKTLYVICLILVFLSIFLLLISIIFSVNGIANVMYMARKNLVKGLPRAIFFHAPSTIDKYKSFENFEQRFYDLKSEDISEYALLELWTVINQHNKRYPVLTRSIRFLLLAIFPMFIVIFCFYIEKTGSL